MELNEWKEKALDTVRGELTLTKLDFCLIGAVCLLAGICIGFLVAPFTRGIGIEIGSNNGNNNTNNGSGNGSRNGNGHDGNDYGNQYSDRE